MSHSASPVGSRAVTLPTSAAMQCFLERLLDYAGLFPPTQLPLEEALPKYLKYRTGDDRWMLGHFICPARRLVDLRPYAEEFRGSNPFPVSVLGSRAAGLEEFVVAFAEDIRAVEIFRDEHGETVTPNVLETFLPVSIIEAGDHALAEYLDLVGSTGLFEQVYVEVPIQSRWREHFRTAILHLGRRSESPKFGLKIRCGGLVADAFPSPEQLAFVVATCRNYAIPFKATAGLHHPVRHYDDRIGAYRHGFLNLFGAAVFAHALDISETAIERILRSETIEAFVFDEQSFEFDQFRVSATQVCEARSALARSFGSCSFDIPRNDLRAARLL